MGGTLFEFIMLTLIFMGMFYILDKLLRKWLRIEKQEISSPVGKHILKWGTRIFIALSFLFIIIFNENIILFKVSIILCLVMQSSFQAFIEWKYLTNSREYIHTIIISVLGLIYAILIFSLIN